MSGCCCACQRWCSDPIGGTVTDTSGGTYVRFCGSCARALHQNADLLDEGVCLLCLRREPADRAEGIHLGDTDGHICDRCRRLVGFDNTDTWGPIPTVGPPRPMSIAELREGQT